MTTYDATIRRDWKEDYRSYPSMEELMDELLPVVDKYGGSGFEFLKGLTGGGEDGYKIYYDWSVEGKDYSVSVQRHETVILGTNIPAEPSEIDIRLQEWNRRPLAPLFTEETSEVWELVIKNKEGVVKKQSNCKEVGADRLIIYLEQHRKQLQERMDNFTIRKILIEKGWIEIEVKSPYIGESITHYATLKKVSE